MCSLKFLDTVVLVSGGASGLGKATVERFANLGSKVILCDLVTSKGEEIAKTIGEDKVIFAPVDVTSEDDVKAAVDLAKKRFRKLDYVVNCAGILKSSTTYDFDKNEPCSLQEFTDVINVNTIGTFNVIRLSAGLMGQNKLNERGERGVIVNIASVVGLDGGSHVAAYAASKAAVAGMTLPIARDLASQAIRVVAIAPGLFDTPMMAGRPEAISLRLWKATPFPSRSGRPSEFAQLVQSIFENPMLNGETIRLDGGLRVGYPVV